MAFSEDSIDFAWLRAGGRCECKRTNHGHGKYRCAKILIFLNRGCEGEGSWEAHRISAWDGEVPSNCEIVCWSCYKKIQTA